MKTAAARTRLRLAVAGLLTAAAALSGTGLTNAAWVDDEYVHAAAVGTDGRCEADSGTVGTASARELGGTLQATDLDAVAALNGVTVSNDGAGTTTASPGAARIDDNTYAAQLDLSVLRTQLLTMSLPLALPLGSADAYSQWGQTLDSGNTTAASGLVTNGSGGISLADPQTQTDPPTMATLDLGQLVPDRLGGLSLDIGAVSSLAEYTRCGDLGNGWLGPLEEAVLDRDYYIAGLDLNAKSTELGTAVTGVDTLLDGVQPSLNQATGTLAGRIEDGLIRAAAGLLGTLRLGDVSAEVTMTPADLSPVYGLLTGTLSDNTGLLTVDLGTGTVRVDLAKASGTGVDALNGQDPNTELVLTPAFVTQVTSALQQVLSDWQARVISALTAAIRATSVTVKATVEVKVTDLLSVAEINLGLGPVSVGTLLDGGSTPVTTEVKLLGSDILGGVTSQVGALASGLAASLPGITGRALNDVLITGIVGSFNSSVSALLQPVAGPIAASLAQLDQLLSIMVNVQPDQPGHPDYASVNPPSITALRLAFIENLDTLDLSLATSFAG
jgi:hypothetical protein